MSDFQAIADRFEIEALRGEFTDALMMRDYDRFASLFTLDGVWRIPYINVEIVRRDEIRAGIERMQGLWDYFVQTPHPGTIHLDGDTAMGRSYVSELGHMRNGRSELNYAVYHDRYERTPDGWKLFGATGRSDGSTVDGQIIALPFTEGDVAPVRAQARPAAAVEVGVVAGDVHPGGDPGQQVAHEYSADAYRVAVQPTKAAAAGHVLEQ
jgi:ketosteroid isomerase-like protein